MPVRKQTTRAKRLNDRVIDEMRELIRQGLPWNVDNLFRKDEGFNELRGLVSGHFYFCTLCLDDTRDDEDDETKKVLYKAVKDELVPMHAHHRPGTRPWAWWKWDAPELRRVVGRYCLSPDHGDDCDGDHEDGAPPACEDPTLAGIVRNYFGAPSISDGHLYEPQYDYLERLGLVLSEEIAVFEKYGAIANVRIASGSSGKCDPCWERRAKFPRGLILIWSRRVNTTSSGFPAISTSSVSTSKATSVSGESSRTWISTENQRARCRGATAAAEWVTG